MITAELNALRDAIDEAKRFTNKATLLSKQITDAEHDVCPSRLRSAAIRASMDLTMALSRFRKARKWGFQCPIKHLKR